VIVVELTNVVIDPVAIQRYVRAGNGPVVQDLMRRATNVQSGAKVYVRKRTRKLERSIVKRLEFIGGDPVVRVGTDLAYAMFEHDGTVPHLIRPVRRQALRFPAGGGVVFARQVRHPGTAGSHFLTRALPLAAN
jgi:hypothetical protein